MNGRKVFLLLTGVVLVCGLASRGAAQGAERPNILWIVAEDNWITEKKDDGKFEDPEMLKELDRRWEEFVKKRRERPEKSSPITSY